MATRKYQTGGNTTPGEKMTKPPKKVTTVSNSGNYKTITKNNTEPYGNKTGSTTKVRRTVKGVLKGAPTVREAKQAREGYMFTKEPLRNPKGPYTKRKGDFQKGGATTKYQNGGTTPEPGPDAPATKSAPVTGFEKRQAKKIARAKTRSAIANIEGEGTVSQKRDNTANRISKVVGTARAKTPKRLSTSTSSSTSTTDNRNSGNTTNTTNSGSSSGSNSGATGGQGGQGGVGGTGGSSGSSSGVDNSRKSSTSVKQTQNNTRTSNNTSNTNVRQSQNNSRNSSKTINQSQDNSRNTNIKQSQNNIKNTNVKQKSTTKVKMQNGGISKSQGNALKKIIDTVRKGPGINPRDLKSVPSSRPGRDIERDIYQDRMYDMYKENAKKPKPLNKPKLKKGMYGTSMMAPSMMRKGGTKKK